MTGTDVAMIVPVPVAASDAPDPTTIAAVVLVLPVSALNAVAPVLDAVTVWFGHVPVMVTLVPATSPGVAVPEPPCATLSGVVSPVNDVILPLAPFVAPFVIPYPASVVGVDPI